MSMRDMMAKLSPEEYEEFLKAAADIYQQLDGPPNANMDFIINAKPGELAELRRKAIEEENNG